MGQYYTPAILGKDKFKGKDLQIIWHANAHNCKNTTTRGDNSTYESITGLKLMEHSWMENGFVGLVEAQLTDEPKRLVWSGDYAEPEFEGGATISNLCEETYKSMEAAPTLNNSAMEGFPFLVNHSKKVYVDKRNTPLDTDGWQIHPLPLLTCEGNGGGGGDFRGNDPDELIGSWARDLIQVVSEKPSDEFKELKFNLVE